MLHIGWLLRLCTCSPEEFLSSTQLAMIYCFGFLVFLLYKLKSAKQEEKKEGEAFLMLAVVASHENLS